ncbi:MAG: hypothetical protein IKQ15_12350, partial [Kiritimatiellae bacterium]|nr:hypothetical protein [Kiritimatiellia bacterium]
FGVQSFFDFQLTGLRIGCQLFFREILKSRDFTGNIGVLSRTSVIHLENKGENKRAGRVAQRKREEGGRREEEGKGGLRAQG